MYRGLKRNKEPSELGAAGLILKNVPEEMLVYMINSTTGEQILLPDDGVVVVFLTRTSAGILRDDLLVPANFPERLPA